MSQPSPTSMRSRLSGLAAAARRLAGRAESNDAVTPAASTTNGPRFRLHAAASGVPRTAHRSNARPAPGTAPERSRAANSAAPNPAAALRERERARTAAVFGSEHSQGRERQAADMLATRMSASEIIGLLAKQPKAVAANPMLDALAALKNPNLGAGAAHDGGTSRASADAVWARAHAANGRG